VQAGLLFQQELLPEEVGALLAGKKIAFLGLARDCASRILHSIEKLSELGGYFEQYRIFVFENDSIDGTDLILKELSLGGYLNLIQEIGLSEIMPLRTERLGYARNALLDLVSGDENLDYICWADLDGLVDHRFSNDGFLSNFKLEAVWDCVFPTTAPHYYDIWALREKIICPDDYILAETIKYNGVLNPGFVPHIAVGKLASNNLLGWFRVDSAFGGMGIYKHRYAKLARYCGFMNGREVCEHVPYNLALRDRGAKMYINPSFVTNL
jgi:glycosyltransferase involved in cell wall biosynthesis